jgi:DNA mismatch repair ATPase MutS
VPKEVIKRARHKLKELEALSGSSAGSTVEGSQLPLLVADHKVTVFLCLSFRPARRERAGD